MGRIWKFVVLISAIILADQLTKGAVQTNMSVSESIEVIPGFFNLTYVRNPGAAFGFMAQAPEYIRRPLFLLIPVLACFWLIWLIWHSRSKHIILGLSYSLILAGAVGNLIDRFYLGYVVDFFDFYIKTYHYPAFNIADSSITIAAILLIYEFIFISRKSEEKSRKE